jgi:hypothetical protein
VPVHLGSVSSCQCAIVVWIDDLYRFEPPRVEGDGCLLSRAVVKCSVSDDENSLTFKHGLRHGVV